MSDSKTMKVVYVAGPFRASNSWDMEQNIRRAEALSLDVWLCGAAAICPHSNTRFYQGTAPDDLWLQGDLAILDRCDAILMTPDWAKSVGATAEKKFAEENGIPVLYTLAALRSFLHQP